MYGRLFAEQVDDELLGGVAFVEEGHEEGLYEELLLL